MGSSKRGMSTVLVGSASPATRYGDPESGGPQIGHIDDGHADFRFPREVRDELIRTGRAIPHPAFPDSRTASWVKSAEDVAGALELFRMNYERRKRRNGLV